MSVREREREIMEGEREREVCEIVIDGESMLKSGGWSSVEVVRSCVVYQREGRVHESMLKEQET